MATTRQVTLGKKKIPVMFAAAEEIDMGFFIDGDKEFEGKPQLKSIGGEDADARFLVIVYDQDELPDNVGSTLKTLGDMMNVFEYQKWGFMIQVSASDDFDTVVRKSLRSPRLKQMILGRMLQIEQAEGIKKHPVKSMGALTTAINQSLYSQPER